MNGTFSQVSVLKRNYISTWQSICQPEKSPKPVSKTQLSVIYEAKNVFSVTKKCCGANY